MKNVKWLSLVLALVLCLFALPAQAEVQMETHTAVPTIDLPDNDELFAGYVEKQLYADLYGGISTFGTGAYSAGSRLEGTAAFIYEKLAAEVQTIAAAGTGTADTIFSFGSSFNMSDGVKVPDYACTITEEDSSFVVAAMNALIADYPYEMYWFDKGHMGYQCSSAMTESGKPIFVEIYLSVIPAYQNGAQYTVKDSGTLVSNVAKAAQAVVDANAGKTDMEKLQAYKEYICGAVSYDFDALSSTYGDPWQLIYVFDGDTSTNVVCEGYSKAFQYLCDLSTFSNETLAVYTVTGTMDGGTGAGDHMWNIVRMDGKSYLVDVTNSEYETVGMDGELFMAKATSGNVADGYVVMGYNDTPVTYVYNSAQESLWGEEVLTLAENVPVASITNGSTVTEYTDFAKALEAWTDGTTLTLLDDVSYGSNIELGRNATRTFVGDTHTLALTGEQARLENYGTLTIASGTITAEAFCVIQNQYSGTLNIEGGTVSTTAVSGAAVMNNSGALTITGGKVSAMARSSFAIVNTGTMTLNGGTIEGYHCIDNYGTAELKDGTAIANYGYALYNSGTATISAKVTLSTEGDNPAVLCEAGTTTISSSNLSTKGTEVIRRFAGELTITTGTDCDGWMVRSNSDATIGKDIVLPNGYYMFVGGTIVTEMPADEYGTIRKHTEHSYAYVDNQDGLTHSWSCTVGCGMGDDSEAHDFNATTGVCVCGAKQVAKITSESDTTGTIYTDFAKALEAWTDGTTLTLLDDVSYGSAIELGYNATRTFVGDTHTLTLIGDTAWINNHGTLTITSGTVSTPKTYGTVIINHNVGTLTINGGKVSAPEEDSYPIVNRGTMTLNGGAIEGYNCIGNYGTAELKDGTAIANYGYALYNSGTATISAKVTLSTEGDNPAVLCEAGTTTISSSNLSTKGTEVIRRFAGELTITTGTDCDGWVVKSHSDATIGKDKDIVLPDGYYMFVDETIVTEMPVGEAGTIRKHIHAYKYAADEETDTITYACSCGIDTRTAQLSAPEGDLVYNGAAYEATVTMTDSTDAAVVTYTQNNEPVTLPINAGDYTATMTWGEKSVSVDFTIAPKPIAATMVEGSRQYNATAEWKVPLILSGVIDGDNVSGGAICTLPSANVGEYTQATINEVLELEGADAGNYTLAKEDVTFTKGEITKAAADEWSVNAASPQDVLVGSGLNEVIVPATGTGIGGEEVQIAQVTFYTDAALQTPAKDADISSLQEGDSITLYFVADTKNYESTTGSLVLNAIVHQHEWTYTADEDSDTITATCGGTIGNCPYGTITFKLVIPTGVDFNSSADEKTATWTVEPAAAAGLLGCDTAHIAVSDNAKLADGKPSNAGEYEVTLFVENAATVTAMYTIAPAQIGQPDVLADGVYTGEAHQPAVTIPNCTEGTDFTVTYPEDMVNAGDKIITVTGIGNYTGTVELPYRITPAPIGAAVITAEAQVYTGEALTPDFTVKLNGKELKHDVDFTFNWSNNVNVGEGKIVITGIGNYEGQVEGTFAITSAPADLTAETYLGETMTGDFTYGDVITIKGAVTVDQRNTFSLRRAPAANEVALYLEGGNEVIAGPVAADPATGEFTLTYDTTNKDIQIGQRNLTLKYVSDGNKQNTTGSLTVTLKQKELTIISAAAAGREYEKDNNLVAVTDVILDGIVGADDVAVTDVQGTLASDNAGTYTTLALPKLELTGRDKDYYSIAADEAVPTDVTISPVVLLTAELPTNVTLDAYLASADQVAAKLPDTITYTDANGGTVALDAAWTCADFDATPKAVNTFTWTVDTTNLTNYVMAAGVDTTGTITVTNTDALPVVITATDDSITFAQQPYDVAGMFDIDANAGDAHYEVVSGDAVLNGTALTVNKVGEIVIRLTTDAHGAYAAAEATATLTVTKADPDVTAPEGLTATYGQTLANVDLPVHGEGTWSWEDDSVRLNKAGPQTYKVVFTPNDTTNWNTLTLDVQVTVDKADPDLAMAVFNGETETYTFTYGETMTVKAMPHLPTILSLRSYTAPAKNQMALFLGDKQISEAVDADENGIYTMTIDTTEKALKIGSNTITAKYTGSDDLNEVQGEATVTLLKRPLGIVNMTAQSRQYEQGNQQVAVTAVELAGKIDGDDVAVATMSAQVSSANVGTYHEAQLPQTVPLTGADADYYEAMGDMLVPVPQLVSITQATPTPTGTGADAGQPAVTPVTEDGKTLADIPLALPEDAYNVPGTIHWVEGDDTPVEEGKEYAWVFIPDDPNYAPVNGTVVIYPAGEAPVITAPTAPQTLNVVEGETGTMTVTATDADAYQWYINRNDGKGYVAIDGATDASYTTSAVKPENDGFTYYCQVSNAYGESKSPVFTLKVKEKVDVPQTGDDAQLGLWLALMVLSLSGMAAMVMNRKRGEN